MVTLLVPPFASWWPNIFAWAVQTPAVALIVWLIHRVMRRTTLQQQQASQYAHRTDIKRVLDDHVRQVRAELAEHRRLMGVADAAPDPDRSGSPTLHP